MLKDAVVASGFWGASITLHTPNGQTGELGVVATVTTWLAFVGPMVPPMHHPPGRPCSRRGDHARRQGHEHRVRIPTPWPALEWARQSLTGGSRAAESVD